MANNDDKLIRSIWPLPGGNKHYLDTLNRVLKWVSSMHEVSRQELNVWLQSQYGVKEATATSYLQVIYALGALEVNTKYDEVGVTSYGRSILDAEGQDKAQLVVERFMEDYLGFREVLAAYEEADGAIHLSKMVERLQPYFPRWTSDAQYEYRALWLLSLGCLEQEKGRYYAITPFGNKIAEAYPPLRDIDSPPPQPKEKTAIAVAQSVTPNEELEGELVDLLVQELTEASTDGQNSQRLEQAVAEAFEFLGFGVDHLGASGETDVVARANVGEESYVVVVDAKARASGKVVDLNVYTLVDHRDANQADYAVVVAGGFAGGKVANHAANSGVLLLPVPLLADWLRLHARTPLNLYEYRVIFDNAGLLTELPDALELAAENEDKWAQLLVDLIELIRETYYGQGLLEPLPTDTMWLLLATHLGGVRYSKPEVQQAIDFLSHPFIGAMLAEGAGVSLAMDRPTLARSLRTLADRIEKAEMQTQD